MKFFATLMLMLAFGLSVAYSQDVSDDDASMLLDRIIKGQVDDKDIEIVDMDDALNKLRMLRKVYRIVTDVDSEVLLHPKKRFILDTFKDLGNKIKNFFKKAWENAKNAFKKAVSAVKEHVDFDTVVEKAISHIHSGMSVAACKKAILAAATAILGPAASVAGSVVGPICDAALAKIEAQLGGGGGSSIIKAPITSRSVYH